MKKVFYIGAVAVMFFLLSFTFDWSGSITGKYTPQDAVDNVWATNGTDSARIQPGNGSFELSLKPGDYRVVIDANPKYQDVVLDRVTVADGKATDLGEIVLKESGK